MQTFTSSGILARDLVDPESGSTNHSGISVCQKYEQQIPSSQMRLITVCS